MSQAIGVYSKLNFVPETTFGTTPGDGTVRSLPFNSCTLSAEQNITAPETITGTRNPVEPILGNINVTGDIVIPVDLNATGWILAMAFGNPTTTTVSTGKYQHVFKIGNVQPSVSIERALSNGDYYVDAGCKVSSLGFSFGGDGELVCTVGMLGCSESVSDSPIDDNPTAVTLDRLNNFQAALKVDNADVAIATEISLDINFGLDEEGYAIGGNGFRVRLNEGIIGATGTMTAFYDDDTFIQKAINATETALQVKLTKGNYSLQIDLPEVLFPRKSPSIEGATGLMQELDYSAFYSNAAAASAVVFTLINTTESYEIVDDD